MTWEVIFLASPGHATPDKPQGSTTFHFTATMQCSTISMQLLHGPKQTSRTAAGEAEIHHEGPETREKILNLMTNVIPIPWPAPCVARGCRIREFHRLGPPNKANWPQAKRAKQSQSSPGEITANPIYCKWLRHNTRVVPPGKQSQLVAPDRNRNMAISLFLLDFHGKPWHTVVVAGRFGRSSPHGGGCVRWGRFCWRRFPRKPMDRLNQVSGALRRERGRTARRSS